MNQTPDDRWNARLYDDGHAFVHQMAAGVAELLAPLAGERILDLGCGTGALARQIADAGAIVVGVDSSPAMIARATETCPDIHFEIADATTMRFEEPFDAIFSNAALHWMKPPAVAIARMFEALRPGGRLILEMGGKGCIAQVLQSAKAAGQKVGIDLTSVIDINYFPSISEYSALLERQGFEVNFAALFDRPTPLNDGNHGLRNWIEMFRSGVKSLLPTGHLDRFYELLEPQARPRLFHDGGWVADYRRLRMRAVRP